MPGEGISIGGPEGVTINGIRCWVVSELAVEMAKVNCTGTPDVSAQGFTAHEAAIALKAAKFLREMRAGGYSAEDARKAFVRKIADEAQRVKPVESAESGERPET